MFAKVLMVLFYFVSDVWIQSRAATALATAHARGQALQVLAVHQGVRQQLLPVAAHAHPPGHQTVPLRDLPTQVHAIVAPAAAHPHAHRRQAVQVPAHWLQQGLLSAEQPAVALALPPDGQAVQVQLVLQVLHGRAVAARAHPQAQGVQASQDAHLPVLRQVVHAGDLPHQAHAEARRACRQAASHRRQRPTKRQRTNVAALWRTQRHQLAGRTRRLLEQGGSGEHGPRAVSAVVGGQHGRLRAAHGGRQTATPATSTATTAAEPSVRVRFGAVGADQDDHVGVHADPERGSVDAAPGGGGRRRRQPADGAAHLQRTISPGLRPPVVPQVGHLRGQLARPPGRRWRWRRRRLFPQSTDLPAPNS